MMMGTTKAVVGVTVLGVPVEALKGLKK